MRNPFKRRAKKPAVDEEQENFERYAELKSIERNNFLIEHGYYNPENTVREYSDVECDEEQGFFPNYDTEKKQYYRDIYDVKDISDEEYQKLLSQEPAKAAEFPDEDQDNFYYGFHEGRMWSIIAWISLTLGFIGCIAVIACRVQLSPFVSIYLFLASLLSGCIFFQFFISHRRLIKTVIKLKEEIRELKKKIK